MQKRSAFLYVCLFLIPGSARGAPDSAAPDKIPEIPTYCGVQPADWPATNRKVRDIETNGPELNGIRLSGAGDPDKALSLAVVQLRHGVRLSNGAAVCDARVQGTALASGDRRARDFSGAMLLGRTTKGEMVQLRIDDVQPGTDPEVWGHKVSWQSGTLTAEPDGAPLFRSTSPWAPLCANGGMALLIAGRWNYHRGIPGGSSKLSSETNQLTFSCENGAIAKCIRFGYKPWQRRVEQEIDPVHQACVRAVRADYCGDGTAMTEEHAIVNFYDKLGIQKDGSDWPLEAEWSAAGAVCVNAARTLRIAKGGPLLAPVNQRCRPTRKKGELSCILDPAQQKTLLWTETRQ